MDLCVKPESIEVLEARIGKILQGIDLDKDFLNKTLKAQATKANRNKWDYIKPKKSFWKAKETISREKSTHRVEENLCTLPIRQKYYYTEYARNSNNLNT
jgi:hypothetical protein